MELDAEGILKGTRKACEIIKKYGYFPSPGDEHRKKEKKPPYLMALFFDIKVLKRYLDDKNYSVSWATRDTGLIGDTKGKWNIVFGINPNDRIHVWLCDFEDLPKVEQMRWLSDQVKNEIEPSIEFVQAQLMVTPAELPNENLAMETRDKINKIFFDKYSEKFFIDNKDLLNLLRNIYRPIYNTKEELCDTFEEVNKVFIESINTNFLKSLIVNKAKIKNLASIKTLEVFLKDNIALNNDTINKIVKPFYIIYDLRLAKGHVNTEEKFNYALERLGFKPDEKDFKIVYNKTFETLLEGLKELSRVI